MSLVICLSLRLAFFLCSHEFLLILFLSLCNIERHKHCSDNNPCSGDRHCSIPSRLSPVCHFSCLLLASRLTVPTS